MEPVDSKESAQQGDKDGPILFDAGVSSTLEERIEVKDWRETLFVWKGSFKLEISSASWMGSWSSFTQNENARDFAETENKFTADGIYERKFTSKDSAETFTVFTKSSSYLLDNFDGRGLKKHRDKAHKMWINRLPCCVHCGAKQVVATGKNEYGPFISHGMMGTNENQETTLTLARRYIDDGDERLKYTGLELLGSAFRRYKGKCSGKDFLRSNPQEDVPLLFSAPTLQEKDEEEEGTTEKKRALSDSTDGDEDQMKKKKKKGS